MLFPPLLVIMTLGLFGLININPMNIQPVFHGSLGQWLGTGTKLILTLLPGTAIFIYMPFVKKPGSIVKISLFSLGIVLPVFFITLVGTIGVFGPALTEKMSWAVVEYFHTIDFPYLLLEQGGLFFLIAWYGFVVVAMAQGLFTIGNDLNVLFPRIKRNWFIIVVAIIMFIAINLKFNIIFLENLIMNYGRFLTFSFLGLILGTWIAARIRKTLLHHP